jgi:hypothetical protein
MIRASPEPRRRPLDAVEALAPSEVERLLKSCGCVVQSLCIAGYKKNICVRLRQNPLTKFESVALRTTLRLFRWNARATVSSSRAPDP